jgi:hypothetical protein
MTLFLCWLQADWEEGHRIAQKMPIVCLAQKLEPF